MNETTLNTNIITTIKELLPDQMNIVTFLSELLGLNKGTTYRRLRGEIPFSIAESSLIAQKIGVSLDYLIRSGNETFNSFELILQQFETETEKDSNTSKGSSKFEQILGNILSDTPSTFELSHNLFPQVPAHLFYHLSKYNSFKWLFKNKTHKPIPFKDVEYPRALFEMHKTNNIATQQITTTSYIWDNTIIEMLVREIKYFASIKLLDNEDVILLKQELFEFLDYVEDLTISGVFPTGNKVNIYISSVHSDAAYSYMESPRFRICIIGVFDLQYIISTDSQAFEIMKGKISSLKKGATLITGSNEIFRISFFDRQQKLISSL